jgi:hypothetical protein
MSNSSTTNIIQGSQAATLVRDPNLMQASSVVAQVATSA